MNARCRPLVKSALRGGLAAALLLAAVAPAAAVERGPYSIEILVDGVPLDEYAARKTTYVAAQEGREYSIRLSNRTGRRIAVALAVDGLNTIDARTTSADEASKWILGPYETVTLDGWQTGSSTARRFYFTSEERSYGAWLGRTRNLGIVSAAVFREKGPPVVPIEVPRSRDERRSRGDRDARPAPPAAGSAPLEKESSTARRGARSPEAAPPSDDFAATGIGRELDHHVRRVRFETEARPVAVLEIRYEYPDALTRLGVLPPGCRWEDPLARRERARGFEEPDFAPDPFR